MDQLMTTFTCWIIIKLKANLFYVQTKNPGNISYLAKLFNLPKKQSVWHVPIIMFSFKNVQGFFLKSRYKETFSSYV